jgi:hypothetical protein
MALTEAFSIGQRVLIGALGVEGEVIPSNYVGHINVKLDEPRLGISKWYFEPWELTSAEPVRPRFATAWMHDGMVNFAFTGDAFMTLQHAEEFARETLENDGYEGQIAVFEIRSVHLARLDISSEKA